MPSLGFCVEILSMSNPLPDGVVEQISAAIFAGRKIEAIRLHRMATGSGLKESKEFIEALEGRMRQESPEKFTAAPSGCSRTAAMLLLGISAAYFIMRALVG